MPSSSAPADGTRRRERAKLGATLSIGLGVLLAIGANTACAAVLGGLSTSVGLLAALAALFLIKSWPAYLPNSVLSAAGGALLIAAAAMWLSWRASAFTRLAALTGSLGPGTRSGAATAARARAVSEIVLPAGFELEGLLTDLRGHFLQLQLAWDKTEMQALRSLTTPEMLDELCLERRRSSDDGSAESTEIVTLRAELLGFESLSQVFVASVEFSGLLRESAELGTVPFRELWLLIRSKHETASAWRLARHQALL